VFRFPLPGLTRSSLCPSALPQRLALSRPVSALTETPLLSLPLKLLELSEDDSHNLGVCLPTVSPQVASTPGRLNKEPSFGPRLPGLGSWSVLVVLHHFDGFLRVSGCGLVASHFRSRGSLCFRSSPTASARLGPRRSRSLSVALSNLSPGRPTVASLSTDPKVRLSRSFRPRTRRCLHRFIEAATCPAPLPHSEECSPVSRQVRGSARFARLSRVAP